MPKCCLCGREASIFAHGEWWCGKHFEPADGEPQKLPGFEDRDHDEEQSDIDLGLKEV